MAVAVAVAVAYCVLPLPFRRSGHVRRCFKGLFEVVSFCRRFIDALSENVSAEGASFWLTFVGVSNGVLRWATGQYFRRSFIGLLSETFE